MPGTFFSHLLSYVRGVDVAFLYGAKIGIWLFYVLCKDRIRVRLSRWKGRRSCWAGIRSATSSWNRPPSAGSTADHVSTRGIITSKTCTAATARTSTAGWSPSGSCSTKRRDRHLRLLVYLSPRCAGAEPFPAPLPGARAEDQAMMVDDETAVGPARMMSKLDRLLRLDRSQAGSEHRGEAEGPDRDQPESGRRPWGWPKCCRSCWTACSRFSCRPTAASSCSAIRRRAGWCPRRSSTAAATTPQTVRISRTIVNNVMATQGGDPLGRRRQPTPASTWPRASSISTSAR